MRSIRQMPGLSTTRSRVRLTLEELDARLPPSSLVGTVAEPVSGPYSPTDPEQIVVRVAPIPGASADGPEFLALGGRGQSSAPVVKNFMAVEVVGGLWRFTGDVVDEAPGGLIVSFGGEPTSLQGATATTNANGRFDKAILLNTDGSDNGLASAETIDLAGQHSNVALYNVSPG